MLESFVEASCAVAIASATLVRVHRARAEARDPRDDTGLQVPNRPIGATVTASWLAITQSPWPRPSQEELSSLSFVSLPLLTDSDMCGLKLCVCVAVWAACAARSTEFPPGWNGEARAPPMGWRSWNAFGNRISMDMMLEATDALVAKEHAQAGTAANVSLCDPPAPGMVPSRISGCPNFAFS